MTKSIENENARHAIDGAIEYGRQGTNKPPTDDHWLMPYWMIGQKLAGLSSQQVQTEAKDAAITLWNGAGEQLKEADDTLREISSYLGMGGCWDTENLNYQDMLSRIKEGIDTHVRVQSGIKVKDLLLALQLLANVYDAMGGPRGPARIMVDDYLATDTPADTSAGNPKENVQNTNNVVRLNHGVTITCEPDWTESETLPSELWKNPLIPMSDRLLIADGAIHWRNELIAKLRDREAQPTANSEEGKQQ